MMTMFEGKPGLANVIRFGFVVFIGLSLVNLYYSIKINRAMDKKMSGTAA